MNTFPFHPTNAGQAAIRLRGGEVCAFPTETVYGLGADATNADAVLKIYETKGRPRFNPLIVHCADLEMAEHHVAFSPLARRLADAFWPGPLSIVLPLRAGSGIADVVTAGLSNLAVRVPGHPLARELIREVGKPLAAPSANRSGRISPTTARQVIDGFAGAVPVLDGGQCEAGLESTIIAVEADRLIQLRAGALARSRIESAMDRTVQGVDTDVHIRAPGMMLSHYAPNAAVRLNVVTPEADEAYLAFGEAPDHAGPVLNLSPTCDLHEAARNLFAHLHALDAYGRAGIAVAPIPMADLGEAINDRLARAAAPRA